MLKSYSKDFNTILAKDEISQLITYKRGDTEYKTRKVNDEDIPLRAVVMGREFETGESEGRLALDTQLVYMVLPDEITEPKVYDVITTLDTKQEYKVKSWELQVNRYKITAEKDKRSTNSHTMGRYR